MTTAMNEYNSRTQRELQKKRLMSMMQSYRNDNCFMWSGMNQEFMLSTVQEIPAKSRFCEEKCPNTMRSLVEAETEQMQDKVEDSESERRDLTKKAAEKHITNALCLGKGHIENGMPVARDAHEEYPEEIRFLSEQVDLMRKARATRAALFPFEDMLVNLQTQYDILHRKHRHHVETILKYVTDRYEQIVRNRAIRLSEATFDMVMRRCQEMLQEQLGKDIHFVEVLIQEYNLFKKLKRIIEHACTVVAPTKRKTAVETFCVMIFVKMLRALGMIEENKRKAFEEEKQFYKHEPGRTVAETRQFYAEREKELVYTTNLIHAQAEVLVNMLAQALEDSEHISVFAILGMMSKCLLPLGVICRKLVEAKLIRVLNDLRERYIEKHRDDVLGNPRSIEHAAQKNAKETGPTKANGTDFVAFVHPPSVRNVWDADGKRMKATSPIRPPIKRQSLFKNAMSSLKSKVQGLGTMTGVSPGNEGKKRESTAGDDDGARAQSKQSQSSGASMAQNFQYTVGDKTLSIKDHSKMDTRMVSWGYVRGDIKEGFHIDHVTDIGQIRASIVRTERLITRYLTKEKFCQTPLESGNLCEV